METKILGEMVAPCVTIFVDGNEVKTRARDLNVLFPSTPIFLTLPHRHRRSQIFNVVYPYIH